MLEITWHAIRLLLEGFTARVPPEPEGSPRPRWSCPLRPGGIRGIRGTRAGSKRFQPSQSCLPPICAPEPLTRPSSHWDLQGSPGVTPNPSGAPSSAPAARRSSGSSARMKGMRGQARGEHLQHSGLALSPRFFIFFFPSPFISPWLYLHQVQMDFVVWTSR